MAVARAGPGKFPLKRRESEGSSRRVSNHAEQFKGIGLDPTKFEDGAELAGRVLEDARQLYGLDDDAAMSYFNGGKAQGDLVHGGRSPSIDETRRYLARARKIEEMADRLPVIKNASPADQKSQAFSHEINIRLLDRDSSPLAEPHTVSTHVGLPIAAVTIR